MQDEVQEQLEMNQTSPRAETILSFRRNDQEGTQSTGTNMQLELLDNQAIEAVDAWPERMSVAMEQVQGKSSHSIQHDRLLLAAQHGDGASFADFLAAGLYDVDVQDPITLDTPLMLAAKLGCLEIVQQCLAAGANVDHVSANGATALMYAAKAGFTAITQVLLDARAIVHVIDNRGETAIKLAVRRGHSNIAWLLFDHGAMYVDDEDYERASYRSRTKREASGEMKAQLCHAAAIGDLPLVRRMLTAGVDVDVVDDEKSTPLLLACFRRHDEIIQELLEYGPNVNSANKFGFTPLNHAAADGNYPLVSTLLALGAAVDTADKFGWTPVMIAARNGHADVMQLLLDSNASPSRRNQMGKTAWDLAFSKGHDCVVAVLDACLESYRAMGMSALEAFDFQAAVDSFSDLIHAVNPPLPFDLFQRCQAWDGLGCASLALDDAKAYLESQGAKTTHGLAKVGQLLYRQSHFSEAMQAYQSGLALEPQDADCQADFAQVERTKTVQCAFTSDVFIHLHGHALFQLFLEIDPELSRRIDRVVLDPKAFDALDKHFQMLLLVLQHKRAADLRITGTPTSKTTLPMRETLPGMSAIVRAFQNDDELFLKLASNASTVGLLGDDSTLAMIRRVQDDPKTLWTEYRMDSSMAAIIHVLFQDEPSEDDEFVLVDNQDDDYLLS